MVVARRRGAEMQEIIDWALASTSRSPTHLTQDQRAAIQDAKRQRWRNWVRLHISGMGLSYVLMLTAFYVDNGKNLPLWRELPQWAFWVLPTALGLPIVLHALLRHPLAREAPAPTPADRP